MQESAKWRSKFQSPAKPLIDRLNEYPDDFVSMRSIIKMGINPKPMDKATPIGIYAFPITCVANEDDLGIFNAQQYVYILRPKPGLKLLELKPRSSEIDFYQKLEQQAWDESGSSATTLKGIPGMKLTKLLKEAGYGGVIDWGTYTVHNAEGCQAVFLGIQTIDVIEMFENPVYRVVTQRLAANQT